MTSIKETLILKGVNIVSIVMFYDSRDKIVFKVLGGSFNDKILYNFICIDYLCLVQDELSKNDKRFENIEFNDLSGIVIPEIFMNLMYCHVLRKNRNLQ